MVSVDTVYQRVLALANKEQRGYITPQEFNLLANQAQMVIFDQYFYDLERFDNDYGNETEYSDMVKTLNEKLSIFKKSASPLVQANNFFQYPADMYKLGTLYYAPTSLLQDGVEIEEIYYDQLLDYYNSPLTTPNQSRPLYIRREEGIAIISTPAINSGVLATYVRKPAKVNWGYVITLGEPMYNASAAVDFELHPSEETLLVIKILEMAGITLNKPGLSQLAAQEESDMIAQQKIKQ
jgi:hypothetical protein